MKNFLKGLPGSYTAPKEYVGQMPDLRRVWQEYMTYAYIFGLERSTWQHITQLILPHTVDSSSLLYRFGLQGAALSRMACRRTL